jgi:toxin-antitoxin system PIN domain toxin
MPDVNVLVYAHREEAPDHAAHVDWLSRTTAAEPFALSELVLSGFLRVVTHGKVWRSPTPWDTAEAFVDGLRAHPNARVLRPGPRHWPLFVGLCRDARARGKLVADAYHAALAIEHGCEWVTADGDFARFAALRWTHPLA